MPAEFKRGAKYQIGSAKDPTMHQNFKFTNKFVSDPNSVALTAGTAGGVPLWFCANTFDNTVTVALFPGSLSTGWAPPKGRLTRMFDRYSLIYVEACQTTVEVDVDAATGGDIGPTTVTFTPLTAYQATDVSVVAPQPLINTSVFTGTTYADVYQNVMSMPRSKEMTLLGGGSGRTSGKISLKENMHTMIPLPGWNTNSGFWEASSANPVDLANRVYFNANLFWLNPTTTTTARVIYKVTQTFWIHAFDPYAASIITLRAAKLERALGAELHRTSKPAPPSDSKEYKGDLCSVDDDDELRPPVLRRTDTMPLARLSISSPSPAPNASSTIGRKR